MNTLLPICLLLALATPAQEARAEDGPLDELGTSAPASAVLASEIVRIPFRLAEGRPIPVVEARVNGRGPFRFYFDTGASVCVFDDGFMRELGIESEGTTGVGDPSGNARIQAEIVTLDELQLGGMRFTKLPGGAFDRRHFGGDEGIRGVLGLPLFVEHLFTLDYAAGEIIVREGSLEAEGAHVLPFRLDPLPMLYLDVNGTLLQTTIDSGSPLGFTLPLPVASAQSFKQPLSVVGRGRTVNSEFEIHRGQLSGSITLGGHVFEDPHVDANEMMPHVNVGYDVLHQFALTFDLAGKKLAFERTASEPLTSIRPEEAQAPAAESGERRSFGAQLRGGAQALEVVMVVPGSEAERGGLRAGDTLVSVDGVSIAEEGHALLARALAGKQPITLGILRAGKPEQLVFFGSVEKEEAKAVSPRG